MLDATLYMYIDKMYAKTYAADQPSTSFGWACIAAFVNCFRISGSSGGTWTSLLESFSSSSCVSCSFSSSAISDDCWLIYFNLVIFCRLPGKQSIYQRFGLVIYTIIIIFALNRPNFFGYVVVRIADDVVIVDCNNRGNAFVMRFFHWSHQ